MRGNMAVTTNNHALDSDTGASTAAAQPNWIVTVSESEALSQAFAPPTESAAQAAFSQHGCVLLRGAFPLAMVNLKSPSFCSRSQAERPHILRVLAIGDEFRERI